MISIYVDYLKNSNIENYHCDGFIIHSSEFSCYNGDTFEIDELKPNLELIKKTGKKAILNIDRIIMEEDLDDLLKYLNEVKNMFDLYLYSDMAIYGYFNNLGMKDKLVYMPKTLVASKYELSRYYELGVNVILANELSFDEIKDISDSYNISLEVFGYHQMFYSKRNLISLYKEYFNIDEELKNKKLTLKEEIRDEFYPIYESKNGTFIYTDYLYCFFKELVELKDKLNIIKINGIFLDDEKYQKVVNIYSSLLKDDGDIESSYQELENVCPNISKGFLLNKSVLLKKD